MISLDGTVSMTEKIENDLNPQFMEQIKILHTDNPQEKLYFSIMHTDRNDEKDGDDGMIDCPIVQLLAMADTGQPWVGKLKTYNRRTNS